MSKNWEPQSSFVLQFIKILPSGSCLHQLGNFLQNSTEYESFLLHHLISRNKINSFVKDLGKLSWLKLLKSSNKHIYDFYHPKKNWNTHCLDFLICYHEFFAYFCVLAKKVLRSTLRWNAMMMHRWTSQIRKWFPKWKIDSNFTVVMITRLV